MIPPFYDDLFAWMRAIARDLNRPCILGVNGPQGCGKTTLVNHLVPRFEASGMKAVAISIDDFYLTHAEQQLLPEKYPGNPYLRKRGYAGTHDVPLGVRTLDALLRGGPVAIPRYDKSAHQGAGDRAPEASWTHVTGPFDVVLFEGWMLGFQPTYAAEGHLAIVDALLATYMPWIVRLDALVQLRMADDSYVMKWRVEAEKTMSRSEVVAYVENFLPAFALYPAAMHAEPPVQPFLSMTLDETRNRK